MPGPHPTQQPDRQFALLYSVSALALWGFVWVHAWGMDMTHDEAYSYFLVKTNYFRAMPGSANTHWLNSLFMEIWNDLFGDSPGWLRLHSVLAFPFFAWAVFLLGRLIDGTMGRMAFYALILFNPYVLDFFSLARGYGLAMTFQAWSLLFFIRAAVMPFAWRSWSRVLLFNILMIGANLSYFYTAVGMAAYACWLLVSDLAQRRPLARGLVRLVLLYGILLLLTVADLLFIKYYGKDLGYGGDEQFVASLFDSVWQGSLYRVVNPKLATWLAYISLVLLAAFAIWYFYQALRQKQASTGLLLSIPLISILVMNIVLHLALRNPYLLYRTALQWYVPGILLICFALNSWRSKIQAVAWTGTLLAGVASFVFVGQFIKQANRQWCYEWSLQAGSQKALADLYAQNPRHPALGYSLSGVFVNYYSQLGKAHTPAPVYLPDNNATPTDPALIKVLKESDFVVSGHVVTLQCLEQLGLPYDIISEYPPGQNLLIRIHH